METVIEYVIKKEENLPGEIKYSIYEKRSSTYIGLFKDKYSGINLVLKLVDIGVHMPLYHDLSLFIEILKLRIPYFKNIQEPKKLISQNIKN